MAQTGDNQGTILEEALTRFLDACLEGRPPDVDEFVAQYPQCQTQLKARLQNLEEIDALFDSLVRADESDFEEGATGLTGRKIGSFEILEMIGRGGMGVVYLARDTKLKRSVAIKSMPVEFQADATARTRFRREAQLLASLNHPNIAAIHEIIEPDESAGYLVLEYVPGQTLAQRIARQPLTLREALSIAQQIAEAVSAAHKKRTVHRDLKPGNIKITPEGKVKVLDFGLAKASVGEGRSGDTTVTQPGRVMGTPAYMSPEQACGKPTDQRSDIWSFGCLLYEMLTGRLPFDGDSATEILARIIEREPDWQALPEETPANVSVLLRRCLEKDPSRRLQHIKDAAIEIRETLSLLASGSATPVQTVEREQLMDEASPGRIKSLAVLPLQNLTGDPEQEYFADGMTEALIANLGKIGALHVRSRTSIMQYKGVNKPLPEIARELNVGVVVEGSVLRVAERVRITAQLIQAPTDTHLWADSYERDLRNILTLLGEVARTIARQIEITLTPDQEAQLAARRAVNPETYNLYLKGMFHLNKATPEGTRIGLDYLHQAIDKDPADPLAYGGLALGYVISTHAPGAPPDAFERAKAAALKALELDDNLTEAHAALAMAKVYRDWDWEGAAKAYQRALQLNPNLTLTRAHYAFYLLLFERIDGALAEMRRVQEVDPLTPLWPAWQGWLYLYPEKYDEAIEETNKSLELYADFPVALYVQGCAYAGRGMYGRAIELHQKAGMLSRQWRCGLACTYAMAGRLDEARQALAELEAAHTPWDTWFIALIYVALGQKDEAFRWLEAAYGPPNHPYLPWIRYSPDFKPLRGDPRFDDLLRRMNLLP
ncbi:MAG: protein kinase domain-containing protein [Planctomycetota bacterium]|jgi:serine/threonine protein kinase/Tfp pilus assembly protein PilF